MPAQSRRQRAHGARARNRSLGQSALAQFTCRKCRAAAAKWERRLDRVRQHRQPPTSVGLSAEGAQAVSTLDLIREAVERWPQFDREEYVDSAEFVLWFVEWRHRAKIEIKRLGYDLRDYKTTARRDDIWP